MNLDVYIFCSLLKDYDEDFFALSFQEQYDSAHKYYKEFLASEYYKEKIDLTEAIHLYLEEKYAIDNSMDIDYEE
jgi:hypothetical protein